jgi:hypothetical protein
MTKEELEQSLAPHLRSADLHSRSAFKYPKITQVLSEYFSTPPSRIGVKLLSDPKNFGNRISESTAHDIDVLVLLATDPTDQAALQRALEKRALRPVPTVLVCQISDQWRLTCQYIPPGNRALIPNLPTVVVASGALPTPIVQEPIQFDEELYFLSGAMSESDLQRRLDSVEQTVPRMAIKRVGDTKNVRNRLREALGRRPDGLLLFVRREAVEHAESILRLEAPRSIAKYVVWFGDDMAHVRRVTDHHDSNEYGERDANGVSHQELRTDSSMNSDLEYRQLERVKQMLRFLPLGADADNLFEEHLIGDDRLKYEPKTLEYLRKLLANSQKCLIVLTGNAGHGKTHMCRRLLEQGGDSDTVMAKLQRSKEGEEIWATPDAALPIRVVKDLSELEPPERAADTLARLFRQQDAHVIVCANEGRLRDVVSRSVGVLGPILDALDRGLDSGETNPEKDDSVHVVNLNFQAATAGKGGFLEHVLGYFLDHQAAWNVCTKCRARDLCPIVTNRQALTLSQSSEQDNRHARGAIVDLVRVAEESGYILTYRETLIFAAYLITGGLSCRRVEVLHRDKKQHPSLRRYGFLGLLFEPLLSEDQSDLLRILQTIKRLDPGKVALRPVDEELHDELERAGNFGVGVFGEDSVQLKTRRDLDREVEEYRTLVRQARRRAWLTSSGVDESRLGISRSQRLGLTYHHWFRALQNRPGASDMLPILRHLVKGLHTIQGAINVDSKTNLHIVDPGFGRSGSHSAIIARSIKIKDLELRAESDWWVTRRNGSAPPILESVEWIDRRVLLIERSEANVLLLLDLAAFEFVMSAADGIVMREFHSADRRRILTRLAHHAEGGRRDSTDEIRVLLERGDGTLTVERDGTILLEAS